MIALSKSCDFDKAIDLWAVIGKIYTLRKVLSKKHSFYFNRFPKTHHEKKFCAERKFRMELSFPRKIIPFRKGSGETLLGDQKQFPRSF